MFIQQNPNPFGNHVGDCVIRAISIVTGDSWTETYAKLAIHGLIMGDMPSSNQVWGSYLRSIGFTRHGLPNNCPDCYTVRDFANDYRNGIYVVATGNHVVAVIDGCYIDDWDSGDEVLTYYWRKE